MSSPGGRPPTLLGLAFKGAAVFREVVARGDITGDSPVSVLNNRGAPAWVALTQGRALTRQSGALSTGVARGSAFSTTSCSY